MLAKHPDPTVDHVLKTWAPRMIVQGIDYNDLMTTGERIRTWDDWCREWCVTAAGHEEFARKAEAAGNRESATEAYLMASMAYHFGCNNSPQNLDEYVPAAKKRVECYAKAAPYLNPPAVRHEVPFDSFRMPAYLRVPAGVTKPPVVITISGLESTKEEARTMEDGFLRRGVATFTFDGPGQGESWFQGGLIVEFERATSAVIDDLEKLSGDRCQSDWRLWPEHGRVSRTPFGRLRYAHQSVCICRRHVRSHPRAQSSRRSV